MGLFDFFSKDKAFVSREEYEANIARQDEMNSATLSELGKYGVTEDRELSLEFFFYSNKPEKAHALAQGLSGLGYTIENVGPAALNPKHWCVSGWTTKMRMNVPTVTGWTKQMCAMGYENDCEFDGWGTNPQQD